MGAIQEPGLLNGHRRSVGLPCTGMGLLGTLKYSAPSRENWNPSSPQCIRQVCQSPSTNPGIDLPSQVLPLDAACTVVPGAQAPLPYHSKMSTSPSGSGSSL